MASGGVDVNERIQDESSGGGSGEQEETKEEEEEENRAFEVEIHFF